MPLLVEYLWSFIRLSGVIVIAIALTSLSGHISGHPGLYAWTVNGSMSVNTSVAFLFVGASLIFISVLRDKGKRGNGAGQIQSR